MLAGPLVAGKTGLEYDLQLMFLFLKRAGTGDAGDLGMGDLGGDVGSARQKCRQRAALFQYGDVWAVGYQRRWVAAGGNGEEGAEGRQ